MSDDCTHGHPHGTGYPCTACLDERVEALIEQRDKAYREVDAMKLQVGEMQKVIDAVSEWNDEIPALSNVEAKLVSAFVAYKNLTEKRKEGS